jgi:tetratricopeptide (TPR) repeat protein
MKQLLTIFLIGVSCFLIARGNEATQHNDLGIAYYNQGRLSEAVAEYQKAIEINSNFVEAHSNLGAAYRSQGKYDLAIASCQKAINLEPNDAVAQYNLGAAYHSQGKLRNEN